MTVIDFYRSIMLLTGGEVVTLTHWSTKEWVQQLRQIGFVNVTATQHPHPAGPNTADWQENAGSLLISADKAQ